MINIFDPNFRNDKFYVVTYHLEAFTNLREAAWGLAIGQSIGNPNTRSVWETDEMFEKYSCRILHDEEELRQNNRGLVNIAFPCDNLNLEDDGISQILCHVAGGQVDIAEIERCAVVDIEFPKWAHDILSLPPAYGISGMRQLTKTYNRPLVGGIVKPKIGMSPPVLLEVVKEMVNGGINFIKEDELLGDPAHCPLSERVPLISSWMKENAPDVIYCFCINGDTPNVLERVELVHKHGGNGVHINVWSGLGVYRAIRKRYPNIFIHFQKSGDKFFTDTSSRYFLYWPLVCKLAGISGVDSIHAGMIGGYMDQRDEDLAVALRVLWDYDVIPALSCGMNPGLVQPIRELIGDNWMANCGGAIHGHPCGTECGTKAMVQAAEGSEGKEYREAIDIWGYGLAEDHEILKGFGDSYRENSNTDGRFGNKNK